MKNNDNWVKIISFDNPYEAQIKKQLLKNAAIESVIVNAKDSMFLIGSIDLYVKEKNEKKALQLIEQFAGMTKINSFILKEPILLFKKYLQSKGIETIIKEKENDKYILDNYELYIPNENIQEVIPYLTGEKIKDWASASEYLNVIQTRYMVELLMNNNIQSFIIKKKDSDFHLEKINIYVKNEDLEKAKQILDELPGWKKIREYKDSSIADLKEDLLSRKEIRAIIKEENKVYNLYTEKEFADKAIDIINQYTEWVEIKTVDSFIDAEAIINILSQNQIEASILSLRDNVFLIGGYAIYVPKNEVSKAIDMLNDINNSKIEE